MRYVVRNKNANMQKRRRKRNCAEAYDDKSNDNKKRIASNEEKVTPYRMHQYYIDIGATIKE